MTQDKESQKKNRVPLLTIIGLLTIILFFFIPLAISNPWFEYGFYQMDNESSGSFHCFYYDRSMLTHYFGPEDPDSSISDTCIRNSDGSYEWTYDRCYPQTTKICISKDDIIFPESLAQYKKVSNPFSVYSLTYRICYQKWFH